MRAPIATLAEGLGTTPEKTEEEEGVVKLPQSDHGPAHLPEGGSQQGKMPGAPSGPQDKKEKTSQDASCKLLFALKRGANILRPVVLTCYMQ